MKISSSILLLLLIISCKTGNSQVESTNVGVPSPIEVETFPIKSLGVSNGFFYMYKSKDLGWVRTFIEKYDEKTHQLISVNELQCSPYDLFLLNGKVIGLFREAKKKTISIYFATIDNGKISSNKTLLLEVHDIQRENEWNCICTIPSEDRRKILLFPRKILNSTINTVILDDNLTINQKNISCDEDLTFTSAVFNDNVTFFLSEKLRPTNEWLSKEESAFNYSVFYVEKEKTQLTAIKFDWNPFQYPENLKVWLDEENNLTITGTYKIKGIPESCTSGFLCKKFNATSKKIFFNFESDYNKDMLAQFAYKQGDEYLKGIIIQNVISKSDGGVLLLFERYFTKYSSGNTWNFDARQIMPLSISHNGQIEWYSFIPKGSASNMWNNGCYLSFFSFLSNKQLCIVYNDVPENMDVIEQSNLNGVFKGKEGSVAVIATVDCSSGKWNKKALFEYKDNSCILTPQFVYKFNNEIILPFQGNKSVMIGKLIYKQ